MQYKNQSFDEAYPDRLWMKNLARVMIWLDKDELLKIKNGDTYNFNAESHYVKPFLKKFGEDIVELATTSLYEALTILHKGKKIPVLHFPNLKVKLLNADVVKMSELNPNIENKPVTFESTILAVGRRQAYIKRGYYLCTRCGQSFLVEADKRRFIEHPKCTTASCRNRPMIIDPDRSIAESVQDIIIQEPIDDVDNNEPIHYDAKIVADDVGLTYMGQRKKITGVFRTDMRQKSLQKDVYIDVLKIDDLDDVKLVMPSDEDLHQLMHDSIDEDKFIEKLIGSFAPHIFGYKEIKLSLLLSLVSMHGRIKGRRRGWINILLVGDPGMAKTMMLEFCAKVTQKSTYTTGKGSTAAGLTAGMVKQDNGTSVLMSGVYPLSNMGYALIDEFDKMSKDDMGIMHEVMENGRVSRAVSGKKVNLPAIAPTIAAANPQFGNYDMSMGLLENINLPTPIINRFDLIFLIKDKVNSILDSKKADKVLDDFGEQKDEKECYLTERELMAFINYVRKINVTLSDGAKAKLKEIYTKLRNISTESDSLAVSPRQLEALGRLTMAHARLLFKSEADETDVLAVYKLFGTSYETFGKDLEKTGAQLALITDSKLSKEQQFRKAWSKVKDDKDYVVEENLYKVLEEEYKWDRTGCMRKFEEYVSHGFIKKCLNMKYRWTE